MPALWATSSASATTAQSRAASGADRRSTRIAFGTWVALLAVLLQYNWVHPVYYGLFYALVFSAPLVPVLNRWRPGQAYAWPSASRPPREDPQPILAKPSPSAS